MSTPGDATTVPPGYASPGAGRAGLGGWLHARREGSLAGTGSRAARIGAVSLIAIVAISLVIVVMAADRPSLLSPTTHYAFYPHWMAGPLGGLWPGLTGNPTTLRWFFSGGLVLMYVGYVLVLRSAERMPARWLIATILVLHAIFLISPPLALTDVFNYINYGRMGVVHNLNPYTTIPISEPHSDPAFILSNWHQLLSPYGPMFTLVTFAVVPLGVAGSFWALKLILGLASLATILLVWKCAKLLGRDPRSAIALVGLNPIVLLWGLGGDHNDFLMVVMITLGVYLLLRSGLAASSDGEAPDAAGGVTARVRGWLLPLAPLEIGAGAAFMVATAVKASGGILLPIVALALLRSPRRLTQVLIGMLIAGLLAGAASLMAFGLHIPDLSTQSRLVTNESVPNLLGLVLGQGGETTAVRALISAILAISVLLCCRIAWRRRDVVTAAGWANVALILTLSWVLPWYVLWILPLAALSSSVRLRRASLLVGAYLILSWAPASALVFNAIGFRPENTPLGRLHHRYVRELLN